jgi:hypothetical protein
VTAIDSVRPSDSTQSNLWTIAAVAVLAYAACDMTHEVLGHGVACLLLPGVRALGLSTVGLQTDTSSRFVAAAGSIANVAAGLIAAWLFRRGRGFGPARYFAWLFAATNLLNGTGYLLFSGVLDFGDWAVVIAPLQPHALWRLVLVVAGAGLYYAAIRYSATLWLEPIRRAELDPRELPRLIILSYVVGGLLLVAGSALNPVGPQLILLSGASSGFGAMAGLTLVPRIAQGMSRRVEVAGGSTDDAAAPRLPFAALWIVLGVLVALLFVLVLGHGVHFV